MIQDSNIEQLMEHHRYSTGALHSCAKEQDGNNWLVQELYISDYRDDCEAGHIPHEQPIDKNMLS